MAGHPRPPTVTVVVVNYDGRDYLPPCLDSLRRQSLPADQIEVVLVDNGSTDGSQELVRRDHPEVRLVANESNTGFAPAVNQGAQLAGGRYLALLNNDAVADPEWLATAVAYLEQHPQVACVASLVLTEEGQTVDFAGGELSFYGHGFARKFATAAAELSQTAAPTLFASGGAMVTRTDVFLDTGGFDADYFAYFEDVDYGWRLWLLGHEVHLLPASKAIHLRHGTIKRFGYARERYLLERNALATMLKNYGEESLARTLPASVLLLLARATGEGVDLPDFAITPGAGNLDDQHVAVPAVAAAHLAAVRDVLEHLDTWRAKRAVVQARRQRSDGAILPLFHQVTTPNVTDPAHLEIFTQLVEMFRIDETMGRPSRVLYLTDEDLIEASLSDEGARAYELATALHEAGLDVTLATTGTMAVPPRGFALRPVAPGGQVSALVDWADVVVLHRDDLDAAPELRDPALPIAVDLKAPKPVPPPSLPPVLERGDLFVCATERQRDHWLGQLTGVMRLNPATFDADESGRALIDLVPHGMPDGLSGKTVERALRGVVDGIGDEHFVLGWSGRLTGDADVGAALGALAILVDEGMDDLRLWVRGGGGPSEPGVLAALTEEAARLGLADVVVVDDRLAAYSGRQNGLRECDVGLYLLRPTVTTRLAVHGPVLDWAWSHRPVIATEGLVDDPALRPGLVEVGYGDAAALAEAIRRLRTDEEHRLALIEENVAAQHTRKWSVAAAPLIEFCRHPHRAPDADERPFTYVGGRGLPGPRRGLLGRARAVLRGR